MLKFFPTWIQLYKLLVSYWSVDSLSRICSAVEVPRFANDCTSRQKRLNYGAEGMVVVWCIKIHYERGDGSGMVQKSTV